MVTPFVSIIIPVYNTEKYLSRCIQSILLQTYSNFELILIDDGSTDSSGIICDSYSNKDDRIRVVHSKNEGAGESRNKGINLSRGEYLVFVDSDDYLDKDYLESLSKHSEDVVFIDVDDVDITGKIQRHEHMSKYKNLQLSDFLRSQMTGKLPWGGVRKCVKRKLIVDNNIKYSNSKTGEEAIYSYLVLRLAGSIGFIEKVCYYCQLHNDSLSHTKDNEDPLHDVAVKLRETVKSMGDYDELGSTVNAFFMVAAVASFYMIAHKYSFSRFRKMAIDRKEKLYDEIDQKFDIDKTHISRKMNYVAWMIQKRLWLLIWLASKIRG